MQESGIYVNKLSKNSITDGGSTKTVVAQHTQKQFKVLGLNWILLRKLVHLEHLAVLKKKRDSRTAMCKHAKISI